MTNRPARPRSAIILPAATALAVAALIIVAWAALSPSASAQATVDDPPGETCEQISQTDRVVAQGISGIHSTQTIERTTTYRCTWQEDDAASSTPVTRTREYTTRTRWTETTGRI